MNTAFSRILCVALPTAMTCDARGKNPPFAVEFSADGPIPFLQLILRQCGQEHLIKDEQVQRLEGKSDGAHHYLANVPGGLVGAGRVQLQVEGMLPPICLPGSAICATSLKPRTSAAISLADPSSASFSRKAMRHDGSALASCRKPAVSFGGRRIGTPVEFDSGR